MEAQLCEQTYAYGEQQYKVNSNKQWQCLMWGWWPNNNGSPEYRWEWIKKSRVPDEVLKKAGMI